MKSSMVVFAYYIVSALYTITSVQEKSRATIRRLYKQYRLLRLLVDVAHGKSNLNSIPNMFRISDDLIIVAFV